MYYRVASSPRNIPDHHAYGYELRHEFLQAVNKLTRRYGNRIGECIDTRHAFCQLRFDDAPCGHPVTEWIPKFLLTPSAPPLPDDDEEEEDPLAGIFGEGW